MLLCPAHAFEDAVRRQVVQSEAFLNFKRERMQQLWRSTTDNPYIQCLRDEHARIPAPRPSFSDYHSVRHPIYVSMEAMHTINKAEACVEHEYESTRCSLNDNRDYVCDRTVFERNGFGETEPTAERAINTDSAVKDALNRIIIDEAVEEAVRGANQE